jgi:AraC-like DNA-binding protein
VSYQQKIVEILGPPVTGRRPSVDQLASKFNISGRTLSRKVRGENTTVKKVVDEHLLSLSLILVLEGRSNEEVASMLGYAWPNSFVRAFRQWKGLTPSQYKRSSRQSLEAQALLY